ncbi:MAG: NAD(P)-dependent oxidoreductase [Chlorobi bacterium]|nr:NAD(P)-dependent oxidoreductase [Chlorobiota bacterium]
MNNIAIIGAGGFVGRNTTEKIKEHFKFIPYDRKGDNVEFFDFTDKDSWINFMKNEHNIIINLAAYGVVKTQQDLQTMYDVNYFKTVEFYNYLRKNNRPFFWIQIGTAFEYDLSQGEITEKTITQPYTHYGISKLMCSQYLLNSQTDENFLILRPFGMFGKYEDRTKIFPYLISAQKNNKKIELSEGNQRRDYLFVEDFANFIVNLIENHKLTGLPKVINLGNGKLRSLRDMANDIAESIENFNLDLWQWGKLPHRTGESDYFYNVSKIAFELGLETTEHKTAFNKIIDYY